MSEERRLATSTLLTVARPIVKQTIEFGDKLALGTGAGLVVLVSTLGDIKEHISPNTVFIATLLGVASMLTYMVARYCAIQATVIADAQDKLKSLAQSQSPDHKFDVCLYNLESLRLSVWPVKWFMAWGMLRKPIEEIDVYVIQKSQKVARYLIIQAVTMFASLLTLIGGYAFH